MYGGQSTHIPMKVNMSGVMPIIFAQSIASLPATIGAFTGHTMDSPGFWGGFLKLFEVPIKSKSKQFATNAMPTKSALDFLTVSQLAKMEGVEEKEPEFAEAEMEEEEEAPALADDAAAKMKCACGRRDDA